MRRALSAAARSAAARSVVARSVLALSVAAAVLLLPAGAVAQEDGREFGDTSVFTRVGSPGQPEGIVVDDDGRVYVSTNNRGKGDADEPSRIFRYTADGELDRDYVIEGQAMDELHGVLGLAFDGDGLLYALDYNPPRVLRIDPASGEQTSYTQIPDLPACGSEDEGDDCEPSSEDSEPWPNWPVFDAQGNLYVTDLHQATIWRIPPAGEAEVWHQSADYDSIFSLNGQQFDANGDLVFVLTGSFQPTSSAQGVIYRLEVNDDGTAGERTELYRTAPAEGPDGMAIGESGRIYVALVTTHQILVLEPDGSEHARFPTPADNQMQEIPYDSPASIAFRGTSILVTNHTYFTEDRDHWAVLDSEVEEHGLPLHYPRIADAAAEAPGDGGENRTADAPAPSAPQGRDLPTTGGGAATVAMTLLAAAVLTSWSYRSRDRHERTTPRTLTPQTVLRGRWSRSGGRHGSPT